VQPVGHLALTANGLFSVAKATAELSSNDQSCLRLQPREVQPSLVASTTTRGCCLVQPWWLALQATTVHQGAGGSDNM